MTAGWLTPQVDEYGKTGRTMKGWDLQLYYPSSTKDMFVEKQQFYAEQVRELLLSQFNDLESDADRYLIKVMAKKSAHPSAIIGHSLVGLLAQPES